MSPERSRATSTDERLDDLSEQILRMDNRLEGVLQVARFGAADSQQIQRLETRLEGDLQLVRTDIATARADLSRRIDSQSERIDSQGERTDSQSERIDALQRTLIQVGGGMIASILVGAAGVVATQV